MKLLAGAIALIIAAAGVVGVISPSLVLELARSLLTPGALYVVAAVRITFGVVLVSVASASRLPRTIKVLGTVIIVAGVLTPFFGVERSRAVFDWWSSQSALFMQAWSGLAVICGLFLFYALTPGRRSAA